MQKISKETQILDDTLDQTDLIGIYRTKAAEYTLFSTAHGTFHKTTIHWAMMLALINLRKLKLYQVSSLITCCEIRNKLQEKKL